MNGTPQLMPIDWMHYWRDLCHAESAARSRRIREIGSIAGLAAILERPNTADRDTVNRALELARNNAELSLLGELERALGQAIEQAGVGTAPGERPHVVK